MRNSAKQQLNVQSAFRDSGLCAAEGLDREMCPKAGPAVAWRELRHCPTAGDGYKFSADLAYAEMLMLMTDVIEIGLKLSFDVIAHFSD